MKRLLVMVACSALLACGPEDADVQHTQGMRTAEMARADSSAQVFVSGFANLYQDWLYPTVGAQPPVLVPNLEACEGGVVTLSATGCAVDDGPNCTGPNGYSSSFRGLPVYSLIGAWSSDPNGLNSSTIVGSPFFVGASQVLSAPLGKGPYYLFLGENDGVFADNGGGYTVDWSWDGVRCGCDDSDGDGVCGDMDNCPNVSNSDQADSDNDGLGNVCDACQLDSENDADGDSICGNVDACPGTSASDTVAGVPSVELGINHFADIDGDGVFDTSSPRGRGPSLGFTIADTRGCNCAQIIEALDVGQGHVKFGCSIGVMKKWVEQH